MGRAFLPNFTQKRSVAQPISSLSTLSIGSKIVNWKSRQLSNYLTQWFYETMSLHIRADMPRGSCVLRNEEIALQG